MTKAVVLAGGFGTRLSEETEIKPKPMVEIGGRPILWHIMKIYAHYGVTDFIICLDHKGYIIKEFFVNYRLHVSDITVDVSGGSLLVHRNVADHWKVTLNETGLGTMTGGRVKRVRDYIGMRISFDLWRRRRRYRHFRAACLPPRRGTACYRHRRHAAGTVRLP
jgi:glucose-1-phosphate cytidylyltransferase